MKLDVEASRLRYKPARIKCLLLAESPPPNDSDRFFYFEDVPKYDSLYITTMKALFSNNFIHFRSRDTTRKLRLEKGLYLKKFQDLGLYIEDASKIAMPRKSTYSIKSRILKSELNGLIIRMKPYVRNQIPVILISKSVHNVCFETLINEKVNILNQEVVPFPIGHQPQYIKGILDNLSKIGFCF